MDSRKFINEFVTPPKGYGNVPFYWWNGDKLDKERLCSQLDLLHEKGISGVQINYCHKYSDENEPHGGHGKSLDGEPKAFTEEWWDFFRFAAEECKKRDMAIGMGDYTVAWIGNGFFTDRIAAIPEMRARELKQLKLSPCEAEKIDKNSIIFSEEKDGTVTLYIAEEVPNSINPMHPECGKMLTDIYFAEFERRCPGLCGSALNYFFQDELLFGTKSKLIWDERFAEKFEEIKGYDIRPLLGALFEDRGDITGKVRLDYNDVKVTLSEEGYFKPIFDFHNSRGMIYGCDQSSRGLEPDEFGDYFRTVRWFTAPGNDTPNRSADLRKVKVNSSVAHLYNRPRVWLEGYHSSGWGTTLESITAPTSDNFIYGANLLNLHGLYYSTHGGFFEWAPPDFHFRMPYWDDEKQWLKKYERMSFLLSSGTHFCNTAIYYPTSVCSYGVKGNSCTELTFKTGECFFEQGLDFDYIDTQSIDNSTVSGDSMLISGEKFKAVVLCGVDAIYWSNIVKLKTFAANGGKIIFIGELPTVSDRSGGNDEVLNNAVKEILSYKNCLFAESPEQAAEFITANIERDFIPPKDERANVHHRRLDIGELYFVRNAKQGSVCKFKATGNAYLLDADSGRIFDTACQTDGVYSTVKLPFESGKDTLLLFTNEELETSGRITFESETAQPQRQTALGGEWGFEIIPTLDNKYGDYYLPASDEFIGVQARFFECAEIKNGKADFSTGRRCEYARSPAFMFKAAESSAELSEIFEQAQSGKLDGFEEYTPWDRFGFVSSSQCEQGWHGLKHRLHEANLYYKSSGVFTGIVYCEGNRQVKISFGSVKPRLAALNGQELCEGIHTLNRGANRITLAFDFADTDGTQLNSEYERRTAVFAEDLATESLAEPFEFSIKSFCNKRFLKFNARETGENFAYRFTVPPTARQLKIKTFGKVEKATANGSEQPLIHCGRTAYGAEHCTVTLDTDGSKAVEIVLYIKADTGYAYGSVFPEPIDVVCGGKGSAELFDWAKLGCMESYSGKVKYTKCVEINDTQRRTVLDLGTVAATCSVEVNGVFCGSLTYSPYKIDITEYLVQGKNEIAVTVANTLCNHYSTIPSNYSNFPQDSVSGLIGPVVLCQY